MGASRSSVVSRCCESGLVLDLFEAINEIHRIHTQIITWFLEFDILLSTAGVSLRCSQVDLILAEVIVNRYLETGKDNDIGSSRLVHPEIQQPSATINRCKLGHTPLNPANDDTGAQSGAHSDVRARGVARCLLVRYQLAFRGKFPLSLCADHTLPALLV